MANLLSTSISGTATTSDSVVIGGTLANNAYNSVSSTRLMFGGGDSNANSNYYIGTNKENYGGNYTKLDLRWHTGIRMGAQPGYGGIRFFSDETLTTRIMSIGETDANIRIDNNLYIGGAGGWITDLLGAKQNASTAITTSNIGSQSVNYALNSTRLYASDAPYTFGGAYPYYMYMTYDGSRWLLQVTPGTPSAVRVNYADSAGSISGFNNPTTAATANTIAYRDGSGDLTVRELVLNVAVQSFTPSSLVAIYPTTNQAVKVDASGARAFLNVPTRTGGDASGTWGISITGNANTATTAGDSTNLGGLSSSRYLYYRGYLTSGNFQTLQSTESIIRFDEVHAIDGWSNAPGGVYTYGGVLSLRGNNFGLQIYGSHTGDLVFKTQWVNDQYGGWRNIIHSANIGSQSVSYATSAGSATTATTATTASNLAANTSPTIQVLNFTGVGINSGNATQSYAIYQEGGAWTHPYPDLRIGYHTGIKIGANYGYNGIRFYNDSDMVTETFSVGNGDNHVRVANNLYVTGTVTGSNLSGTNTGDQTNISGNAATATTATNFNNGTSYSSAGVVYVDTLESVNTNDWLELVYYGGLGVRIGTGVNGNKALYAGSLFSGGSAVITAANIGSQSVSYAASAGSAGTVTGSSTINGYLTVSTNWGVSPYTSAFNIIGTHPSMTFRGSNGDTHYLMHMDSAGDIQYYFGPGYLTNNWTRRYEFTKGGNFSVLTGNISASGTVTGSNLSGTNTGDQTNISGNAARATRANGNFYIDDNYGNTVVGVYTSTRYQGVFAMGDAYKLPADGTSTGSLYGLAWSHPNAGGVAGNLNDHGLLVINNGVFAAAISSSIRAAADMRAPIFYDSQNTGYYGDFASTSVMNAIRLGTSTNNGTISGGGDWGILFANDNGFIRFGPGNSSWAHIYSDKNFYFNQELYVNGTQVVKNSGSWGISITGSATSLDAGNYITRTGTSGDYNQDFRNTPAGSVRHLGDDANVTNNPGGAWWFIDNYRHSNGSSFWGTQVAWGWEDNANRLATRNISGGNFGAWVYYLNSSNFTTYAQEKENQRLSTTSDVTHNSTTSPLFLVNGHSDNTKGYRIHNTSGSSVSAMFTNSSNQLVIAAGAVDQINLNKKVYVNAVALGVNIAPSATAGRIDASNDIVAFSSSDERLKENITPIANALDKVKSLTGVEFDWKPEHKGAHGHEGHDTGIIAQRVLGVMPSAVRTNDTGYLAVRYEKLIGLLIEGMKEQQSQIEELKAKLDGLTK